MLRLFADPLRDDILRHRLARATACLAEIHPGKRVGVVKMESLHEQITAKVWRCWWAYHKTDPAFAGRSLAHLLTAAATLNRVGTIGGVAPLEWLRAHLIHRHWRGFAVAALGALGEAADRPALVKFLSDALCDDRWWHRRAAAEAAGALGIWEVADTILPNALYKRGLHTAFRPRRLTFLDRIDEALEWLGGSSERVALAHALVAVARAGPPEVGERLRCQLGGLPPAIDDRGLALKLERVALERKLATQEAASGPPQAEFPWAVDLGEGRRLSEAIAELRPAFPLVCRPRCQVYRPGSGDRTSR